MIGYERVERKVARSQAEYNAMTGLVVVTKKLGKWNTYGYRAHNLNCLHYYETLYLIDIVGVIRYLLLLLSEMFGNFRIDSNSITMRF